MFWTNRMHSPAIGRYDPGIPGWQLNVLHSDGRQVRGTIYMWDYNLYITRAISAVGDTDALMLDQSIFLLNADGSEVDTGTGNTPVVRPE